MWFLANWVNEPFAFIENAFSDEECDEIIRLGTEVFEKTRAYTFGSENQKEEERDKVRRSDITWFNFRNEECNWLYRKCTDLVTGINNQFFQFDLIALEELQFTHYYDTDGDGGMYDKHADYGYNSAVSRKLSFSVQLTDPDTYEGGELLLYNAGEPARPSKKRGTINFFPSFMLHEVTPVTKGTRYSLVGWVNGPKFR